jgi:hypothetical protein
LFNLDIVPGILNVRSFGDFEALAKRLFLIADTLVLRDTRDWALRPVSLQRSLSVPLISKRRTNLLTRRDTFCGN